MSKSKKQTIFILVALTAAALITVFAFSSRQKTSLDGKYIAVNPPVESGEMVIKEIKIDGDNIQMISGDISQTSQYKINGDKFSLITKYGTFEYTCEILKDGITIDGIYYKKQ